MLLRASFKNSALNNLAEGGASELLKTLANIKPPDRPWAKCCIPGLLFSPTSSPDCEPNEATGEFSPRGAVFSECSFGIFPSAKWINVLFWACEQGSISLISTAILITVKKKKASSLSICKFQISRDIVLVSQTQHLVAFHPSTLRRQISYSLCQWPVFQEDS